MPDPTTLPLPIRALYRRTHENLKPKLGARLACIAMLEKTPRRQWRRVAGKLSRQYSARFPSGFSRKNILNLFRKYRARGPEALMLRYVIPTAPRKRRARGARRANDFVITIHIKLTDA